MQFPEYTSAAPLRSHHETGTTVIFQRDPEFARAAVLRFSRQLRTRAHDADTWHALGAALAALGERVRACAAFRQAMEIDGARRQTQVALGNLLFDCGQWERALHCFECAGR
jgi:Flp pilus assembly protein TadD